jgi:hypothetical protein
MNINTIKLIKENPLIYNFLRDESYHYKYLYRDSNYIYEIEKLAKTKYKLRSIDKIDKIKENIDLIQTFLDVLN